MDGSLIIALLLAALVVIIINSMALWRYERRLDEQTRSFTRLTIAHRELELRLDRLASAIDQSRQQLYRAMELSSTIHRMIYGTVHQSATLSTEDISTINTYLIEIKAIAVVNGSTDFIERVGRLREAIDFLLSRDPDDPTPTLPVSRATEDVQRKIYDLLAEATRGN